jgi:succinoglycan biosynthesis protein ExoV
VRLYYYQDPVGNFGDDLNPWLWSRLFSYPLEKYFDDDTLFIGIGSILNQKIPQMPPKKVVFGSGYGYGLPPTISGDWRIICVRGPLTSKVLGLPASTAISDGAMLVRRLLEPNNTTMQMAAFMPHHLSAQYDDWASICESLSIRYIDPTALVEEVLDAIRHSSLLITEAMHGAIVADTLRVPWIPVRTRPGIVTFKWEDWSSSLGIEHSFEWLPPIWNPKIESTVRGVLRPFTTVAAHNRLKWLLRFGRRRLSDERVFRRVYQRLSDAFDQMAEQGLVIGAGALTCDANVGIAVT